MGYYIDSAQKVGSELDYVKLQEFDERIMQPYIQHTQYCRQKANQRIILKTFNDIQL